jgi:hypothetical protein
MAEEMVTLETRVQRDVLVRKIAKRHNPRSSSFVATVLLRSALLHGCCTGTRLAVGNPILYLGSSCR